LTDSDAGVLARARPRIHSNLETCLAYGPAAAGGDGPADVLERITIASELEEAVSQVDYVVEAIFEELEAKHRVLRQLEEHCPPHVILTSTTSGYCVRDLAAVLDHPERFLVTHFWNPPYVVPVVEVIPGSTASTEAVQTAMSALETAGKVPVLVRKDVPGFVGNRLQHALRREAISIVAQGIASAEDVDLITRLSFGLRLPIVGPLETADLGGLDLTQAIQSYLLADLDRSTEPSPLINDKVARGELGAKAGRGFFEWPADRLPADLRRRDVALLEMVEWLRQGGYLDKTRTPPAERESP
jgi:3-hydroxybutyryl-CoA dehydrogenase